MKKKGSSSTALDQASCIFGAELLLKHTQALQEETEGVRAGSEDIEFVHRSRVASRRLRAALPLFQECLPPKKYKTWLAEIRNVTRALGEARDVDVQIEALEKFSQQMDELRCRPGLLRLMLRLKQKRARIEKPVRKAMEHLIELKVIQDMQKILSPIAARADEVYLYTPVLYRHGFNAIITGLDAFLAYGPVVTQPEKVEELHEMRIAAKRLRYTIETFAPLYSDNLKTYLQVVKSAQETLGDIHDCDVWMGFLPVFLEEEQRRTLDYYGHTRPVKRMAPGIEAFAQDRRQAREESYQAFVTDWTAWLEQDLWADLRKAIQVPSLQPKQDEQPKT